MGMTASFLPKPIAGINGSGMHTNMSLSKKGKNMFFDAQGEEGLSKAGWEFVDRILNNANEICLLANPSVNAYRRLDPHYEAPNQICASAVDRTSMVRIPLGNEKSARIEVRTVAPDANPYITFLALLSTGLNGPLSGGITAANRRDRSRILPTNIYDAIKHFQGSAYVGEMIGKDNQEKIVERKLAAADRCPRDLGTMVKTSEVLFHHEVTNQHLWSRF
jgi:glutamine synthetase